MDEDKIDFSYSLLPSVVKTPMSAIDLDYDGDHASLDEYDEFGNYDGSNTVVTAQKQKKRKNNVNSKWWSYSTNDLTIFHKFKDIDKERVFSHISNYVKVFCH